MKNALVKVENDINSLMGKIENPLKETLGFIKKHKKFLIILGVIYLVYRYLFAESNDWEEE